MLCAAAPRGSRDAIEQLREVAANQDVDATVVVGDLSSGTNQRESYRSVFRAVGGFRSPVNWVPGPGDAPVATYLREAYNIEVASSLLHGIHGTLAFTPGQFALGADADFELVGDRVAVEAGDERVERVAFARGQGGDGLAGPRAPARAAGRRNRSNSASS